MNLKTRAMPVMISSGLHESATDRIDMAMINRFHLILSMLALMMVPFCPTQSIGAGDDTLCRRCHLTGELENVQIPVDWESSGHILSQTDCPGLRRIKAERLLTESRLLKLDSLVAKYRGGAEDEKRLSRQISLISYRYEYLLSQPLASADAFAAGATALRLELEENVNRPMLRNDRINRLTWVTIAAGATGLAVLGLAFFRFGLIRWQNRRKKVRLDRAVRSAVSWKIRSRDTIAARGRMTGE